ncbi:MAG: hypothetical protein KJ000_11765 [Pirellulaceae bacterium]|nr:hypothetical protein [Pirellulaceae bacterium]
MLVLDRNHFGGRPSNQQRLQHALPSCRVQFLDPGARTFWDSAAAALHGR